MLVLFDIVLAPAPTADLQQQGYVSIHYSKDMVKRRVRCEAVHDDTLKALCKAKLRIGARVVIDHAMHIPPPLTHII